jgi:hypothetical protein
MINLCAPSIIYLIFSITQILIDTFKGLYNTAFIKVIVTVMVTLLLNIMCERGLSVVSWIIVFIPFILMTVVVSMILYVFGLDAATGRLHYDCYGKKSTIDCNNNIKLDSLGNIIIYDPEYNPTNNPVYYKSPNIIIPNPSANDLISKKKYNNVITNKVMTMPTGSSSPAYQS